MGKIRIAVIIGVVFLLTSCTLGPGTVSPTATPAPKAAVTPTPLTKIPDVNQEVLEITEQEMISEDTLPKVGTYFFGESISDIMEADCSRSAKGATWCQPYNGAALTAPLAYENAVCGVTQDTAPLVKLLGPNNEPDNSISARISVYLDCWLISYQPRIGSDLGTYQVTFEQNDTLLADTFTLALPSQPTAAWKDDCAWFAGYQPGQNLRLITVGALFSGQSVPPMDPSVTEWQFIAERNLKTDGNGMAQLCMSGFVKNQYADVAIIALAEGEENLVLGDARVGEAFVDQTCVGSAKTRLRVDGKAQVVVDQLGVSDMPVTNNQEAVDTLHSGESVLILDGPVCTEFGIFSWKVRTSSGGEGWVIEVNGGDYNLEPE